MRAHGLVAVAMLVFAGCNDDGKAEGQSGQPQICCDCGDDKQASDQHRRSHRGERPGFTAARAGQTDD